MKFLLIVIATIGLFAVLSGMVKLLAALNIADDHARSLAITRHAATVVVGGLIAYFSYRSVRKRSKLPATRIHQN